MDRPLSVSEITERIKALLESHFNRVYVSGEVGNLTYHSSGHIYFSLKDENARVGCAMWRSSAQGLKFRLEEGQKIIIDGSLSLYTPRGEYKIICNKITPDGVGALTLAYEQLKKKLAASGYFDPSAKKTFPKFPKHIVIVTSASSAALQDMLRVADKRWKLLKITVIDTLVQGEGAKNDLVGSIKLADALGADVMIVGRGGGSLEDLWAFNEETVAQAIYEAKTPVVSAVGHEVDYLISDFVADLRAPTPSAAMEMLLPDSNESMLYLDELSERFDLGFSRASGHKEKLLQEFKSTFLRHSIDAKIAKHKTHIEELSQRFGSFFERILSVKNAEVTSVKKQLMYAPTSVLHLKSKQLEALKSYYEQSEPVKRVKKGYAEVSRSGEIIELKALKAGEKIALVDGKNKVDAEVLTNRTL